jgi:hypothetical protein
MDQACRRAGIHSAEEIRELGADETYRRLLLSGTRPHFIGYYVIEMGLQGRPWNDCHGKEKTALRKRFDAIVAGCRGAALPEIERRLDEIGVGLRR